MRSGIALAATALILTTAFAAPAAASTPRPGGGPDDLWIKTESASGNGCTPDSVGAQLTSGRTGFTVYYKDYTARAGGSSNPDDARRTCQVALRVMGIHGGAHGLSYAVTSASYHGHADVHSDATATLKSAFSFEGGQQIGHGELSLRGPFGNHNFGRDAEVNPAPVWKPCDTDPTFNINTELRVTPSPDRSLVNLISMNYDDYEGQSYNIQWRTCP
jgi:hypothetical protein